LPGIRLVASVLLATGWLVACGGSGSSPTAPPNGGVAGVHLGTPGVIISATGQNTFDTAMEKVTVGEIIQWNNTGPVEHDIVFSNNTSSGDLYTDSEPALEDAQLVPGGVWQVKFTKPGTYSYFCTFHDGMIGSIVVTSS
jgi:plastocyanin